MAWAGDYRRSVAGLFPVAGRGDECRHPDCDYGLCQLFVFCHYRGGRCDGGSTGNRNVGLYFAAPPPDPAFALFTAIYQVLLYLSPLMLGGLGSLLQRRTKDRGGGL